MFALLAADARAAIEIRALTEVIEGHQVGGVTADMVGDLYVADFGDTVWKITMEGERRIFATGLYGSSGNAIDAQGNLLQANFYGDSITKIDRKGEAQPFASGLSGPVGVTVDRKTGEVYVANCRGNSVARIAADGTVTPFAKSDLFKCPNGIAFDGAGNLYTVNFRDNRMLKIDPRAACRCSPACRTRASATCVSARIVSMSPRTSRMKFSESRSTARRSASSATGNAA